MIDDDFKMMMHKKYPHLYDAAGNPKEAVEIPAEKKNLKLRLYSQYNLMFDAFELTLFVEDGKGTKRKLEYTFSRNFIQNVDNLPMAVATCFEKLARSCYSNSEAHNISTWVRTCFKAEALLDNPYDSKLLTHGSFFYLEPQSGPIKMTSSKPVLKPKPESEAALISQRLPGVKQMILPPCGCWRDGLELNKNGMPILEPGVKKEVWSLVQHLNDKHKWTRERIADWLDDAHDAGLINIEF